MLTEQRYCLIRSESCDWFMVPVEKRTEFKRLCEECAEDTVDYARGISINHLTFTDPSERFA